MVVYDPGRHVVLPACAWEPGRAREWLARWSDEALAGWARGGAWPMHPRDAGAPDEPLTPKYSLYFGAGGVWLALARVADVGWEIELGKRNGFVQRALAEQPGAEDPAVAAALAIAALFAGARAGTARDAGLVDEWVADYRLLALVYAHAP